MKIAKLSIKKIVIGGILLVLLLGGTTAFVFLRSDEQKTSVAPGEVREGNEINLEPATEEEQQQAKASKDKAVERNNLENQAQPSTGKKSVKPVITYLGQVDQEVRINAYVPGVFEDGGTCTAVLTQSGSRVTGSSTAFGNVSTTNCPPVTIPRSQFPNGGDWQLVVEYNSSTATGISDTDKVNIQ